MGSSGPPPRSSWRTPFRCGSSRWWSRRRRTRRGPDRDRGARRVSFWEYLGNRHQHLLGAARQRGRVVFQCIVVATVIGVLLGVVTYGSGWAATLATTATSTIATVP